MIAQIINIQSEQDFTKVALDIFKHQFEKNTVYRSFCDLLYIHPGDIKTIEEIPFLPIRFFKSHTILSSSKNIQETFISSGTTGSTSSHFITDLALYETSFQKGFQQFYGNIEEYVVIALLPNYLEQKQSSLVYMVDTLIRSTKNEDSGFYLNDLDALIQKIIRLEQQGQKTVLIGVSFALLDLVEKRQFNLKNTIVMETGGMKGRRKEIIREELHTLLKDGFGVDTIHSEYGMTELLSQAYSKGNGIFHCPPWMKVLARDTEDPLSIKKTHTTGGINIIDLANYHSCSFIATQDLGKVFSDGSFEILGRFDHSDVRGCNLMVI